MPATDLHRSFSQAFFLPTHALLMQHTKKADLKCQVGFLHGGIVKSEVLRRLQTDGSHTSACNLRVFVGLHPADANSANALPVFHDRHATFQHAVNVRRT